MPKSHRHSTQIRRLPLLAALSVVLPLSGCGQTGELYFAEDDPQRAERDARGKSKPFPFPDTDEPWPPPAPVGGTATDTAP